MSYLLIGIIYFIGVMIAAWVAGYLEIQEYENPILFAFLWPASLFLLIGTAPIWIPFIIYHYSKYGKLP